MTDLLQAALNGEQEAFEAYEAVHDNVDWDGIRDADGNTVLILAASAGKLHIVQWLHERGAKINATNHEGKCAVEIAFKGGHPNTTRGILSLYEKDGLEHPMSDSDIETLYKK